MANEMENQQGRFNREWPELRFSAIEDVCGWLMNNRGLEDLANVIASNPSPSQALVWNGTHWVPATITESGASITEHSQLSGLDNDDHLQYLNEERAENKFYTKSQIDDINRDNVQTEVYEELESRVETIENKPQVTPIAIGAADRDHNHDDLYYKKQQVNNLISDKADTNHNHSHDSLTNLNTDSHTQYHNDARGDLRYYKKSEIDNSLSLKADSSLVTALQADVNAVKNAPVVTPEQIGAATAGHTHGEFQDIDQDILDLTSRVVAIENDPDIGVTDHGELSGLADDDHPQYLNNSRGDTRYYTKNQADTLLNNKADNTSITQLSARTLALESRQVFDSSLYFTKTDINSMLSNKVNVNDFTTLQSRVTTVEGRPVFDSSLYYNKSNIDNLLSSKTNTSDTTALASRVTNVENRATFDPTSYYTKTNIDTTLNGYYTKGQTDTLLINKTNVSDTTALTTRVTTLEGRAIFDSSLYYNKTQIDSSLALKANLSDLTALTTRVNLLETDEYPLSNYGFNATTVPITSATGTTALLNGKLYLVRTLVPANVAINKISFYITNLGLMLLTGTSGVAVYSEAGAMLGSVINTALFGTLGWRTATLSSTIAAQSTSRYVWVGIMANVTTSPVISSINFTPSNGGVSTTHRKSISATGVATFPSSITPATYGSLENDTPLLALSS